MRLSAIVIGAGLTFAVAAAAFDAGFVLLNQEPSFGEKIVPEMIMYGLLVWIVKKVGTDLVNSNRDQVTATKNLTQSIEKLCTQVVDNHREALDATVGVLTAQGERTKVAVGQLLSAIQESGCKAVEPPPRHGRRGG